MSNRLCQPCERQKKQEPVSHWCIQCNERLCALCFEYHKVLTITKDHSFLTSNEYFSIAQLLETLPLSCKTHANKLSYFCSSHEVPCCIICTVTEHKLCNDVKRIAELVLKPEYEKQSNDIISSINNATETLENISENRSENLEKMDHQYEQCKIYVQDKKQHLQKLLVDLDKTFHKFDNEYQIKRQAVQNQIESFSSRLKDMKERRCMIQTLLKLKQASPGQFFFAEEIIKGKNDEDVCNLRESVNTLSTLQCMYSISFKPDDQNENILMIDTLSFKSLPCNIESLHFSMHDRDSSTVEAEEENHLQPSPRSHQELSSSEHTESIGSKDNAIETKVLCASRWKTEACLLSPENYQSKLGKDHRLRNQNKIPNLIYKCHFHIEKKNPNIDVRRIMLVRDSKVILAERSQPRLLTFNTSGSRLSELSLQHKPEDMAIVPDNKIAVTLRKTVLIIDVSNLKDLQIAKEIKLTKQCHGVTFINDTLLVNCLNSDLAVITLDGSIVQKHTYYGGILNIAGRYGDILSVKRNSEIVNFFKLSTTEKSHSRCPGLFGANGIVADKDGNIFITCDYSNKVYMLQYGQPNWKSVLDAESKIDSPRGIAYDAFTNDIAIVNNAGKSVYIFKMA